MRPLRTLSIPPKKFNLSARSCYSSAFDYHPCCGDGNPLAPHTALISCSFFLDQTEVSLIILTFSKNRIVSFGFFPHIFASCLRVWHPVKKVMAKTRVKELFPVFSPGWFMASGLVFRSLTHLEFIFLSGVRRVQFHSPVFVNSPSSQHHWRDTWQVMPDRVRKAERRTVPGVMCSCSWTHVGSDPCSRAK